MRKTLIVALAIVAVSVSACRTASAATTNYANDGFIAQISMDAFNQSVKHRMQVARFAFYGDVSAPPEQYNYNAVDASCAPRTINVWADGYGSWGKQKTTDGYRFNVGGPALGIDWTNGPMTVGIAGTYNWGKAKARNMYHDRKTRTWALTAYAQWNYERFYVNAAVSYANNRYKSNRGDAASDGLARASYRSNSWNAAIELGTRLNICNFVIEPNIGFRYFNDRRKAFTENLLADTWVDYSRRNYRAMEMPVGVDLSYDISIFNTMIKPRLHAAWVPTFARREGKADGTIAGGGSFADRATRGKHGWELGAGFQTKVFRGIFAHVDYTVVMHTKAYEHMLNAGLGWQF